jgi:hypothetical protein
VSVGVVELSHGNCKRHWGLGAVFIAATLTFRCDLRQWTAAAVFWLAVLALVALDTMGAGGAWVESLSIAPGRGVSRVERAVPGALKKKRVRRTSYPHFFVT